MNRAHSRLEKAEVCLKMNDNSANLVLGTVQFTSCGRPTLTSLVKSGPRVACCGMSFLGGNSRFYSFSRSNDEKITKEGQIAKLISTPRCSLQMKKKKSPAVYARALVKLSRSILSGLIDQTCCRGSRVNFPLMSNFNC